jgi:hypothetical protein
MAFRPCDHVTSNPAFSRGFRLVDIDTPVVSLNVGLEHTSLVTPSLIAIPMALQPGDHVSPFSVFASTIFHIDIKTSGMSGCRL